MEICIDIVQRLSLPRYIYIFFICNVMHENAFRYSPSVFHDMHNTAPPLDRELRHPRINLFLETIRVFDVYRKTTIFSARTCR